MLACLLVGVVCIACDSSSVAIQTDDAPIGLQELTRLDLLPRFKRSVRVGSFSSYDRTGGNDDGFSGAYSFVRKDDEGLVSDVLLFRGASEIPPVADRRVSAPDRIVFRPGWSVPVDSFSFQNMTVTKIQEELDGENTRYLKVRAHDEDIFGPDSIGFRCELPEAGTYAVSIEAIAGPDQASVQIFKNEKAEGEVVDLYRLRREKSGPLPLAEMELVEGENVVLLKLIGKNPQSSGLGLDVTTLTFERVR